MGSNRKRRVKALEPHSLIDASNDCNGVENSTKRSVQQQFHNFHKGTGNFEKDEHSSPSGSAEALSSRFEIRPTRFLEEIKSPALDPNAGGLHPSSKIKLQLFPIDESTRLGLEKDAFHPYLELTLSTRKKISSVLKHIDSKWSRSSIAVGELMLFPYKIAENLANYTWTRNDISISAGDVYATIGSPAVFRLRYGWKSNLETKTMGQPSASAARNVSSNIEDVQKGCDTEMQNRYGNGETTEMTSNDSYNAIIISGERNAVVAEKMPSAGAIECMDNEVRMDSGNGQSLALWADSLTNFSIGGLLSEVSLQGRLGNCDPKTSRSNAGLQSSLLISDSFDSFLAGQMNFSQISKAPSLDSHSSILDAEDTCHAFSFQKFSSMGKDANSGGIAYSHSSIQDTSSKSFKYPNPMKGNIQSQSQACQQSDTDLLLCSRVYNDENSLGLSGIKWTDSLGPFDLGLSSSRKIVTGDNISIGSIIK